MLTVSQLTYYVTMLNSREQQSDILRQKRQQLAVKPPQPNHSVF
jgi:hypothetical protein